MRVRLALIVSVLAVGTASATTSFPTYPYFLPAIAEDGGPDYVIPGKVTDRSLINFSVSGQACEQADTSDCFNAAGILTLKGAARDIKIGETGPVAETFAGYKGPFAFGSLVMVIEGVGAEQVFLPTAANGLGSTSPPTSLTLSSTTTFHELGFSKFNVENAHIKFYVVDNYYPDNSQGFLLSLQSSVLTYDVTHPSSKIEQLNGPCDWETWGNGADPCEPTAASASGSEVLGNDLGFSFEDETNKKLIFLFGDTIGIQLPISNPVDGKNNYQSFAAHDAYAIADIPTADTDPSTFTMSFTPASPSTPNFVTPFYYVGGKPTTAVDMGGFDVPETGIESQGTDYIVVDTGSSPNNPGPVGPRTFSYAVLVKAITSGESEPFFSEFKAGRTISTANIPTSTSPFYQQTGHFVFIALAKLPLAYAQQIGLSEPGILMIGNGEPNLESIYLAVIPESNFWTGEDAEGNKTTRYFAGLDSSGLPTWTDREICQTPDQTCAVPVVYDNPTGIITPPGIDPGTAGDKSLAYNAKLGLWLLTWEGGRQTDSTTGIYFSEASAPWGPWSPPHMIFNACDSDTYGPGYGAFMRYVASSNVCPDMTKDAGPEGPITGTTSDPFLGSTGSPGETAKTRPGHVYAPFMIHGLTRVNDGELSIFYNMSTWNPYTAVMMQSNFTVTPQVW
jgi:hypothetical protein